MTALEAACNAVTMLAGTAVIVAFAALVVYFVWSIIRG